ncbi:hypothetical protein CCHR01_10949 [Colletotrichum chrysophilum]|uniref:Uncharacterized protein n=1 Tax=Colletotrichum chrysophilum TaxID=1836956 RepID=A0AAD9AE32_9PEZI|nr:hypothetical protein CCHR01_10949 [Colletotrichum chrysophilum]
MLQPYPTVKGVSTRGDSPIFPKISRSRVFRKDDSATGGGSGGRLLLYLSVIRHARLLKSISAGARQSYLTFVSKGGKCIPCMWDSRLPRYHLLVVVAPYMTPYSTRRGFHSLGDNSFRSC